MKTVINRLDNSIRKDTDKGIGKKIAQMEKSSHVDKNVFMP
jgi:hypothetical protein